MKADFEKLKFSALYRHPEHSIASAWLCDFAYPWEALSSLADVVREWGRLLPTNAYDLVGEEVWIAKTATVAPSAFLGGPCIIGDGAEIRHCAFIRGSAVVGAGAVVGNSTELKNCILFDRAQVPHYNYVGDSILGYRAHMGAGAVTSNVKSDQSLVSVSVNGERVETGRKKFGALLGDFAEVGCNSVLNPGTVIAPHSNVYPLSRVRGYVPENSIFKDENRIVTKYETL